MSKPKKTELSILIPVRNEGKNIETMLQALNKVKLAKEMLVIYDFPEDNTIPVVKNLSKKNKKVRLVQNRLGRGVANAIRAGINAANGNYILILAADDLGPVKAIKDMVALMDQGCDFVSCTRYAYGGSRDKDSLVQRFFSEIGNKIFRLLSGSVFTDLTTGFKMFKKPVLKKIRIESDSISWAIVFEMAIKAQAAGMRLGEVPVKSSDRKHGKSTFKLGPWFKEYIKWFLWGIRHLRKAKVKKPIVRIPANISLNKK